MNKCISYPDFLFTLYIDTLQSFVAVPIRDEKANHKSGQDRVQVIACLVNRKSGDRFDEKDVRIVQECFRVTLGVLLNTMAYEEEKRLRTQCQSLLAVARNLFTHLGNIYLADIKM